MKIRVHAKETNDVPIIFSFYIRHYGLLFLREFNLVFIPTLPCIMYCESMGVVSFLIILGYHCNFLACM